MIRDNNVVVPVSALIVIAVGKFVKMAIPRRDNFLRAGKIWMKIWSISGLTCLTIKDSSVYISQTKVLYSALITIAFCVMAYFRYALHDIDAARTIDSNIKVYTGCSSVICSALMVSLTMMNRKREYMFLSNMYDIRRKYLLVSSSFLFQGQIQYYSTMIEDGLKNLNDKFKILEDTASTDRTDGSVKELRGFRLMYHELSTHSKSINELFGSRIVLTVGHNFALGVLLTFNAIFHFIYPAKVPIYPTEYTSFLLTYWALCCFLNLYFLIQPSEKIRNQARYTPIAVQSLSTRPGYKKTLYDELKLFSAQLVLNDFEPAPHNFLVLNNRMLLSTLGAVGSSLAILLQMLMSTN